MQYRNSRQEATGLVVNKKVNVRKEYYKLARSMCWQLVTKGAAFENVNGVRTPMTTNKLRGVLAFIYHVKRWDDERREIPTKETERRCFHRVYADLLNYLSFLVRRNPPSCAKAKQITSI